MFIPYKDDNLRILFPFVTYIIIAINISVFLIQNSLALGEPSFNQIAIRTFGFTPKSFNFLTIFSSMFIHGGLGHIFSNMWFLYIFGDNVESILGHINFLKFYLFCGLGAAITQFCINPDSIIPMVGASGAIAGVLGAYMLRFPKARVHVLAIIIIFITTFNIPAQIVLGIWFLMQISGGLSSLGIDTTGGVAWFAHIGGFITGVSTLKYFQYNE
tara:strand:- start:907 stop:1551 length:645 start_codon:yes stop_codon:yes gene_type:complete